jgi:hypothetical protein
VKRYLAAAALLALAGCGGDSSLDDEPDLAEPAAMMLRLSDLPAGFRYGDDQVCGNSWSTDGNEPELAEFLIETRPRGCIAEFAREWGGPPRIAQATLFLFESDDDAKRAWELRKQLFDSFGRIVMTTERGHGDAVVFDSNGLQQLGAGEAWRDGRLVVAVYEEGLSDEKGRAFAAHLAEKQRGRIASPSNPAKEDDREIGLEDPAIAMPVYWLGRAFEPEGLPELTLYRGDYVRGDGPGNEVKIDYEADGTSVTLALWKPERWRRFKATRLGKIRWSAPCARRTELEVPGGRAEIYGAYGGACRGEPNRWLAHVYYDEVVVAVNMAYGEAGPDVPGRGRYNSRDGMEAVVRGLRRR